MKCPKCGIENNENAKTFNYCKRVFTQKVNDNVIGNNIQSSENERQIIIKKPSAKKIKVVLTVLSITPFIKGCDQGSVNVGFGFPFSFYYLTINSAKWVFSPFIMWQIVLIISNVLVAFILFNIFLSSDNINYKNGIYMIKAIIINLILFWSILLYNIDYLRLIAAVYLLIPSTLLGIGQIWFIVTTIIWFSLFKFQGSKYNKRLWGK
jgi:hypothetical protein